MLSVQANEFSLEMLLHIILNSYFNSSRCLSVVSDMPLYINFPVNFVYLSPSDKLTNQLLKASEMGCSDYIVYMYEPWKFMSAFEDANHLGNGRRSDRKLVFLPTFYNITSFSHLLNILSRKESEYIANLLLVLPLLELNSTDCDIYDLVTHKFVGSDVQINNALYLDQWNSCTQKFKNEANLFPHDLSNLYGKTVKIACFTYKPYVLLDLDTTIEPLGRDGIELRLIDEFCRWVNCTVVLVRDDEHQWGEIYDNGTATGVIGTVLEDRADMGITALYLWYEEYLVLDFSATGVRTAITCLAPAARVLVSWEMPLLPFSWTMWIALLLTFLYASIALMIASGCDSDKIFLTTFGMMITQSQQHAGSTWRIRSVTVWMLLTGLVLDNAYGGGLASTFTVPKYEQSIDTVQELVNRKMEWGATHDAWIFSLALSQDPLIKKLVQQFKIYPAETLRQKSFTRNMAFSIEKLPAGYFAIGEYITKEAVLDLELMLEDFYYELCVIMLRKNSPYTNKISTLIGRLHQSGLLLAWETQVALKHLNYKVQLEVKLSRSRRDVDNVKSLTFGQVVGIFFIYFAGVSLSMLLFIAEVCVYSYNKKKKS